MHTEGRVAMARATAPITVADADKFREEVSLHTLPRALCDRGGSALGAQRLPLLARTLTPLPPRRRAIS